ncbi:MAG: hypothetical protein K2Q25_07410 [Mycobacteriaceae bacterium]|nr:hypothetical protein [Mycobacteriaceae bacterium]
MTTPPGSPSVDQLLQRYREAGADTSTARRNFEAATRAFERGQSPATWAARDDAYQAWVVAREVENAAAEAYYEGSLAAENGGIEMVRTAGSALPVPAPAPVLALEEGPIARPGLLEIGADDAVAGERLVVDERVGYLQKAGVAILFLAVVVTLACLLGFGVIATRKSHDGGSDDENPDTGAVFAVSENCFQYADHLVAVDPGSSWASGAAADFRSQIESLQDALQHTVDLNRGVHQTVQTQAKQVHRGKETLGNVLNGLIAAVSIAEALSGAGPAGPAISHQFQLATASAAVATDTDTTNGMHEDAQRNAEHLAELTHGYGEALSGLAIGGCVPV